MDLEEACGGDRRRGLADGRHRLRPGCVPEAWRARTPRRPPTICIIIRPAGVVVPIASVKLRNSAPASPSCSMIVSTSRRERDSRFQRPSEAFSRKMRAHSAGQRHHLSRRVLIVRGNASVTDQHCIKVLLITLILQYRFATPKPLQTRQVKEGCKTAPDCVKSHRDGPPAYWR